MTFRLARGFVARRLINAANRAALTGRPKTLFELRVEALGWWVAGESKTARICWRHARRLARLGR